MRHTAAMTATLEQIHKDPSILDRAIHQREQLEIIADGIIAATFTPASFLDAEKLSPVELGRLADALADAPDDESAAIIREKMMKGFYGTADA